MVFINYTSEFFQQFQAVASEFSEVTPAAAGASMTVVPASSLSGIIDFTYKNKTTLKEKLNIVLCFPSLTLTRFAITRYGSFNLFWQLLVPIPAPKPKPKVMGHALPECSYKID